ncbi:MAG: glycosyltransferase family 2 protein, partial [Promethearchaeota archaeon]
SYIPLYPIIRDYLLKYPFIHFYSFKRNRGKGKSVVFGIKHARGKYIIIQDADLEYNPSDLMSLLSPILQGKARVVYGTRFKVMPKGMSKSHFIGNKILTSLTNILFHANLSDMETGYKLFPSSAVLNQEKINNIIDFELEAILTIIFLKKGYKIYEVPIKYRYRLKGNAKINISDGIDTILVLFRERFFADSHFYQILYLIYKKYIKQIISRLTKKWWFF